MVAEIVTTRALQPSDRPYIFATWLQSACFRVRSRVRARVMDRMRGWVERCLRRGRVVVAVHPERPDVVQAWICVEGKRLHFVYVPVELRGQQVATRLIAAALGSYPSRIESTAPWPHASKRFVYVQKESKAA